ncbi:MAG: crossover junction endodeoxyribonuclease RuvC [Candidatus Taylorbacteria bacterium]|nr:crossover junction endodeoxyribonuclease RuvC [Candidatus Taylorbacteria bacterium]
MKVIGIDPGYERLGIAIVEKPEGKGKETLLFSECFRTSAKTSFPDRLKALGEEFRRLIEEFEPEALSIETIFFTTNQKTAIQVAEARGVLLYEARNHNLSVFEYSPLQIKIAITSYGKADKKQIISMIPKLVYIEKVIEHDDEYDAIAAALTHLACHRNS